MENYFFNNFLCTSYKNKLRKMKKKRYVRRSQKHERIQCPQKLPCLEKYFTGIITMKMLSMWAYTDCHRNYPGSCLSSFSQYN